MIRKKTDPIEQSMEIALRPGRFIKYDDAFEFVQGLENVKSAVVRIIKADQPASLEFQTPLRPAGSGPANLEFQTSTGAI